MKRYLALAIIATAIAAGVPTTVTPQEKPKAAEADVKTLVQGNNEFAFDLYRQLSKKEGNLVFSPYSISSALAMTYAGARGETAQEMAKTLHFSLGQDKLHPTFARLNQQVLAQDPKKSFQLHLANALWGQKGLPFREEFVQLSQEHYQAGLRQVDFRGDPDAVREVINRWVEDQTQKKIRDLLSKEALTPLTRLVLTNALYFRADWATRFKEDDTRVEAFQISAKEKVQAAMMRQVQVLPYAQVDNAQIVELPYKGSQLSLLVILPRNIDGLAEIEKSLTAHKLKSWREKLEPSPQRLGALSPEELKALAEGRLPWPGIDIVLPKFKVTTDCSLKKELTGLGMALAFTPSADFLGMVTDPRERLKVDAVLHKAYLQLNEQGTEAAAATAVVLGVPLSLTVRPDKTVVFRADRPFIYLVQDMRTGTILFLGRVVNPTP